MSTNILYITHLVDFGGGERGLYSIIERIDRKKFTPVVVCPKDGPLAAELRKINIKVIITKFGVAKKIFKFFPVISIFTIFRFAKILAREKIDIIHSNSIFGFAFCALPAKIMNIPLVLNVHGWTSGAGLQGSLFNFFTAKLIAVSGSIRNFILKDRCILAQKVETIPLGVDLKRFVFRRRPASIKKELGIDEAAPLIGMIARFQSVKGHYYFLKSAAEIKKQFSSAKFLIVGAKLFSDRPQEGYPRSIKTLIKKFNLDNECILTGFRDDIPEILSSLEVLVLPSFRESFGLILVEAMAVGVPVVATRCGGPEDIIENNISGLLVETKNAGALSEAIMFFLRNKEQTENIVACARQRVEDLFDLDIVVKKIGNVYSEALGKQ